MLNLHAFPFAVSPALPDPVQRDDAPDGFALAVPPDRLPPFVLTRRASARRIDCVRLIDADTGTLVLQLDPTPGTPTPTRGLAYQKFTDAGTDYLVYFGAILPDVTLPCRRLRLEVDEFLSAVFLPHPAAGLLLAEWYHPGPLAGLPYGTGLRQRLYVPGGLVRYADPKEERTVTKDPDSGQERVDFVALTRQGTFTTAPVPQYLVEALQAARAHRFFSVEGEAVELEGVKPTAFGEDAGRWSVEVTVKDRQVLLSSGCAAPALVPVLPPADYAPARWRCGDPFDTHPDWTDTGDTRCQQDATATWVDTGSTRCQQE